MAKWLDILTDPRWKRLDEYQKRRLRDDWVARRVAEVSPEYQQDAASLLREKTDFTLAGDYIPDEDTRDGWDPYQALGYGFVKGLTGGWWGPGGREKFYKNETEKRAMEQAGIPTEKKWGWVDEADEHFWMNTLGTLGGFVVPLGVLGKIAMIPKALKTATAATRLGTALLRGARAGTRGAQVGALYGLLKRPEDEDLIVSPWDPRFSASKLAAVKMREVLFNAGLFATFDATLSSLGLAYSLFKNMKPTQGYAALHEGAKALQKGLKIPYKEAQKQALKILERTAAKTGETMPTVPLEPLRTMEKAFEKGGVAAGLRGLETRLVGRTAAQTKVLENLRKEFPAWSEFKLFEEAQARRAAKVPEYLKAFPEEELTPNFEMFNLVGKELGMTRLGQEKPAESVMRIKELLKEGADLGDVTLKEHIAELADKSVLAGHDLVAMERRILNIAKNPNLAPDIKQNLYKLQWHLYKSKEFLRLMGKGSTDFMTNADLALMKWYAFRNRGALIAQRAGKVLNDFFKKSANPEQAKERVFYLMHGYKPTHIAGRGLGDVTAGELEMGKWMRGLFDDYFRIAEDAGIPINYRADYMPLVWKGDPAKIRSFHTATYKEWMKSQEISQRRGLRQVFDYAKPRQLELEIGEKWGLVPIKDPKTLLQAYQSSLFNTLANRNLLESLQLLKVPYENHLISAIVPAQEVLPGNAEQFWKVLDIKGVPKFKVAPQFYKALKDIFDPAIRLNESNWFGIYRDIRNNVKRFIMANPAVHGSNIFSDVLNESVGWLPWTWPRGIVRAFKTWKYGGDLWESYDKVVEEAVASGLNVEGLMGLGNELFEHMGNLISHEVPNTGNVLWRAWKTGKGISDRWLWNKIVRNSQLGLWDMTNKLLKDVHPSLSKETLQGASAHYVNDLLGTLPSTVFRTFEREGLSILLFARNWTISNLRLITGMLGITRHHGIVPGKGIKGLPSKVLSKIPGVNKLLPKITPYFLKHGEITAEQMEILAPLYTNHVTKGLFLLASSAQIFQIMALSLTNQLKDRGILDTRIHGEKVPIHGLWSNPPGHRLDIDTGCTDRKGNRIYFANFLFRYINDYVKWLYNIPETAYNKIEPLLKGTTEALANHSVWRSEKIADPGEILHWGKEAKELGLPEFTGRFAGQVWNRGKYIVQSITPSPMKWVGPLGEPGYRADIWEMFPYVLGTHRRRGLTVKSAAWDSLKQAHKIEFFRSLSKPERKALTKGLQTGLIKEHVAQKLLEFRQLQNYRRDVVDTKIDTLLEKGKMREALRVMVENNRYTDYDDMLKRLRIYQGQIQVYREKRRKAIRRGLKAAEALEGEDYTY